MGAWSPDSRSHVATMSEGDFRATERSTTMPAARTASGSSTSRPTATVTVLKDGLPLLAGEVIDAAVMRAAALDQFLTDQVSDAKAADCSTPFT